MLSSSSSSASSSSPAVPAAAAAAAAPPGEPSSAADDVAVDVLLRQLVEGNTVRAAVIRQQEVRLRLLREAVAQQDAVNHRLLLHQVQSSALCSPRSVCPACSPLTAPLSAVCCAARLLQREWLKLAAELQPGTASAAAHREQAAQQLNRCGLQTVEATDRLLQMEQRSRQRQLQQPGGQPHAALIMRQRLQQLRLQRQRDSQQSQRSTQPQPQLCSAPLSPAQQPGCRCAASVPLCLPVCLSSCRERGGAQVGLRCEDGRRGRGQGERSADSRSHSRGGRVLFPLPLTVCLTLLRSCSAVLQPVMRIATTIASVLQQRQLSGWCRRCRRSEHTAALSRTG